TQRRNRSFIVNRVKRQRGHVSGNVRQVEFDSGAVVVAENRSYTRRSGNVHGVQGESNFLLRWIFNNGVSTVGILDSLGNGGLLPQSDSGECESQYHCRQTAQTMFAHQLYLP